VNLITEYLKDSRGIQLVSSGSFDYHIPAASNPLSTGNPVRSNLYNFSVGLKLVTEENLHDRYRTNGDVREFDQGVVREVSLGRDGSEWRVSRDG
jgi:hypothetical protein